MEKQIIDYVSLSGKEILSSLLNVKSTVQKIKKSKKSIGFEGIAVNVGLLGELRGKIILNVSEKTAQKIAEKYLQEKVDKNNSDLIESVIMEISNMIAGRIITLFNNEGKHNANISPPKIHRRNTIWSKDENQSIITIPFKTNLGDIILICVWKQEQSQK